MATNRKIKQTTKPDADFCGERDMTDFWMLHGWWFLLGLAFFPRITVWFFSAVTGGFLFWLGFLFFPRIFIAVIACYWFWDTNPVLCVMAILGCLGGVYYGIA